LEIIIDQGSDFLNRRIRASFECEVDLHVKMRRKDFPSMTPFVGIFFVATLPISYKTYQTGLPGASL